MIKNNRERTGQPNLQGYANLFKRILTASTDGTTYRL